MTYTPALQGTKEGDIMIRTLTTHFENLTTKSPLLHRLSVLYYGRLVRKEITLADIGSEDRVLFIGGGATPLSALLIAQATGAAVTAIDNDAVVIGRAGKYLKRFGKAPVRLEHAEGAALALDGYTVIIVARQVVPSAEVLRHILNKSAHGVRILFRCDKGHLLETHASCTRCTHHFSLTKSTLLFTAQ